MDIKIEKGVPIPKGWASASPFGEALKQMEVGDSFILPSKSDVGVRAAAKRVGVKITVRKVEGGQRRVWRRA